MHVRTYYLLASIQHLRTLFTRTVRTRTICSLEKTKKQKKKTTTGIGPYVLSKLLSTEDDYYCMCGADYRTSRYHTRVNTRIQNTQLDDDITTNVWPYEPSITVMKRYFVFCYLKIKKNFSSFSSISNVFYFFFFFLSKKLIVSSQTRAYFSNYNEWEKGKKKPNINEGENRRKKVLNSSNARFTLFFSKRIRILSLKYVNFRYV